MTETKEKKHEIRVMIKQLFLFFGYLRPYLKLQIYVLVAVFVTSLLSLLDPMINKFIIDEFLIGKNFNVLYYGIILHIILFLLNTIFNVSRGYLLAYTGNLITLNIRKNILKKIIHMKTENKNSIDVGEIYVTFDNDVIAIEQTLTGQIMGWLMSIIDFVIVCMIVIALSWKYFMVIFIAVPFYLVMNNFFAEKYMKINTEIRDAISSLFSYMSEIFHNIDFIKVAAKEEYFQRMFFKKNRKMVTKIFNFFAFQQWSGFLSGIVGKADYLFLLAVGGVLVYSGDITIGTYFALSTYADRCKGLFMSLLNIKLNLAPVMVSIDRIKKIFDMPQEENKGKKISALDAEIKLESIDFYYNVENKVLDNVNLVIKKGEKIGIVGESGSGKSTLIKLLLGMYEPCKGNIIVNNVDLKEINKKSFRKKIGMVTQDNFFFKDTIRNNLLLGKKCTENKLEKILKVCQIDEYINSLPEGIESVIEFSGNNVSGGQKQRLAIARMLLRDPDMIILDEATSAMDNITEAKIQKSLEEELKDKTVITIAHRLSTIENSDRIIVLKNGKIIETGRHQELLNKKGYYFKLIKRENEEHTE